MKSKLLVLIPCLMIMVAYSCRQEEKTSDLNIIFLHHSTGATFWNGSKTSIASKVAQRLGENIADFVSRRAHLPSLIKRYNNLNNRNYTIKEMTFPKAKPYGWNNFPYDYYNIWVKNAGEELFMEEPTLEILTKEYQVIIFKHCFPVSNIQSDLDTADINSNKKTIANYKLQYSALRDKLHHFPETKFILFTGAAQTKSNITEDEAKRAKEFFKWVTDDWDLVDDNIYLWDLYKLQTEGDVFFIDEYALSPHNSHPNKYFAGKVVNMLFNRIIDVIENDGLGTKPTGEKM